MIYIAYVQLLPARDRSMYFKPIECACVRLSAPTSPLLFILYLIIFLLLCVIIVSRCLCFCLPFGVCAKCITSCTLIIKKLKPNTTKHDSMRWPQGKHTDRRWTVLFAKLKNYRLWFAQCKKWKKEIKVLFVYSSMRQNDPFEAQIAATGQNTMRTKDIWKCLCFVHHQQV